MHPQISQVAGNLRPNISCDFMFHFLSSALTKDGRVLIKLFWSLDHFVRTLATETSYPIR